ncbi:TonB-dependent receptor [Sphingomonas naasensis]|uniref:TonB-dependent receptor n=1 Tax=Sphingomonas naasensis TaxID=1344951 RepID=UPI001F1092BE|nr:TonB-dependent receptor [Sphingomonas naasensis]NIJ19068.1 TonB-dependent receptor [Sphingomonas naasensis]
MAADDPVVAAATPQDQTQTTTTPETSQDEVVVTGIRASLTSARNIKRNADQIVDSISAQDIGALPDRSVSEALQRIPGITLQRTNENRDPARLAAEGGGVFIRGLSWVRSEINGRDVFSANNGRGLSFEDVSPDLLAGVDVYKNPSAEMVEGGVGGIVNLRTRKPFDQAGQLVAVSADYNYADMRGKGYWSGNALYSNRFNVGGGEVGILLSASINNIGNRTDSIQLGTYTRRANATAPAAFQNILVPSSLGWRRIDWEQRRTSYNGSLQWSPSSDMTFTAEAFISSADPKDMEHAEGVYQLPDYDSTYQLNDDGVLEAGTYRNANMDLDTRYGKSHKVTRDYSLNWKWTPGDHLAISADVQRITSKANVHSFTGFSEFGVAGADPAAPGFDPRRPDIIFDLSGNTPSVTTRENGASLGAQNNYWWAAAMDHLERNRAGQWAERLDLEYSFDDDSFLKSFRAGVRATDREAVTRQTGYNWGLLSMQFWGNGGGAPVYLNQTGNPPNAGLPEQSELFTYDDFFRGSVAVPGVGWFPSTDLMSGGTGQAYNYLRATETSGWGWAPLTNASFDAANPAADNVLGGVATQKEKTLAGYGMLRFGAGILDGNIGVRVVRTKNEATGYLSVGTITSPCTATPTAPACSGLTTALAFSNNGAGGRLSDATYENSYTDVLPTLNLRLKVTDQLQLRFAAGRAMVRPNFSQLRPYASLSFTLNPAGTALLAQPQGLTGQAGNPYLKPTKSDQFDFSAEYYFGKSNSITFAAFYKDVRNYIISGNVDETYVNNGQSLTFNVTRAVNGEKGKIKGFEFAYTQFFDMLPGALGGLGFSGNLTYVDSTGGANQPVNTLDPNQITNANDTTLPLEGLSKWSYNLAAIYEKYGVSARVAYNWRSEYLLTTSAANLNAPVWSEDYGQLDASLLVNITNNIKIGVQGTNLLNTRTFLDVGGAVLHPRYSWTDTDRRIAGIIRASF